MRHKQKSNKIVLTFTLLFLKVKKEVYFFFLDENAFLFDEHLRFLLEVMDDHVLVGYTNL